MVESFGLDHGGIIINDKNNARKGWRTQYNKVIHINSDHQEETLGTLPHEVPEVMFNPLINRYVRLVNILFKYIEGCMCLGKRADP